MTVITKNNGTRQLPFDELRLISFIEEITGRFPHLNKDEYIEKNLNAIRGKSEVKASVITNNLILNALDYIGTDTEQHPDWTYVAEQVFLRSLYKKASKNRSYDSSEKYGDFYGLIKTLATKGIYDGKLLRDYNKEEIKEIGKIIEPERDLLFNYIGLRTLADRYLATDHDKNVYELPQERWLVIAMALMREEKNDRLNLVKEAYWALSNMYMTVATPTLKSAGLSYGQLSSCFIDTVDDSLRGIYDSNTDVANLSKNGGGIN
jgi:ribonucleoside-diphosphate reductase alpha chain